MHSYPMGSMRVHQVAHGLLSWPEHHPPLSLSLSCKRLRPLTPGSPTDSATSSSFDLKSFIRPDNASAPTKLASSDVYTTPKASPNHPKHQVESHPGGTRWNPTQEQIEILEMLYRGGMRTPNAQQIEQITSQLSKYGKIQGKNVFYWFQNHKARERQKQKRNSLGLAHSPRTSTSPLTTMNLDTKVELRGDESSYKRKSRSWGFEWLEEDYRRPRKDDEDGTLELFPLHPEGR